MAGARILLVDDEEGFLYSAAKTLRLAGYDVVTARDYRDALPLLERGEPVDLLMTDVVMPDRVNGFALARMARMINHRIRIIYATGYDVPVDEAIGKVLRKPIRDDQMVAAIHDALAA